MTDKTRLTLAMMEYYKGDPKRIQHFLKVHAFAKLIGEGENVSQNERDLIETAALTHDIGIKNSELKYGNAGGKSQEKEGPPEAERMLSELGYPDDITARVCYLVGHHHTYNEIDGVDYQILVEADFLVNFFEDELPKSSVLSAYNKIFKTETGKKLCQVMFDITY